jgi:hypothetical protein
MVPLHVSNLVKSIVRLAAESLLTLLSVSHQTGGVATPERAEQHPQATGVHLDGIQPQLAVAEGSRSSSSSVGWGLPCQCLQP